MRQHQTQLTRALIETRDKRIYIEKQEQMAAKTENYACQRLGKIVEESKQRLDFIQEFSKLKRIHNQTLKKVAAGQANG